MATAQEAIDRARQLINDTASAFVSGLRWSDSELLEWLTDGQREIVKLQPEANAITEWFDVEGGSPCQFLDPANAYKLIRVEANGSGKTSDPVLTQFVAISSDTGTGLGVGPYGLVAAVNDLSEWTVTQIPESDLSSDIDKLDITGDGEIFVACGYTSLSQHFLARSSNGGASWSLIAEPGGSLIRPTSVCGRAGRFVLAVENGVYVSQDGSAWSTGDIASIPTPHAFSLVRHLNGQFMLIAGSGVAVSADGLSWTHAPEALYGGTNPVLCELAYGNGLYVLRVSNVLYTSPNATTWTFRTIHDFNKHGIAYSPVAGVWVMVNTSNIKRTADPTGAWTTQALPAGVGLLLDVLFDGASFVAAGEATDGSAIVVSSADGVNWQTVASGMAPVRIDRLSEVWA